MSSSVPASEVRVGDRLQAKDGTELTVTRIEPFIFPPMIAFIEDSEEKWFKMPAQPDAEVTLLARG